MGQGGPEGCGAPLPPPATTTPTRRYRCRRRCLLADLGSVLSAWALLQKLESLVKEYGSADKAAALAGEQRWPLHVLAPTCPSCMPWA